MRGGEGSIATSAGGGMEGGCGARTLLIEHVGRQEALEADQLEPSRPRALQQAERLCLDVPRLVEGVEVTAGHVRSQHSYQLVVGALRVELSVGAAEQAARQRLWQRRQRARDVGELSADPQGEVDAGLLEQQQRLLFGPARARHEPPPSNIEAVGAGSTELSVEPGVGLVELVGEDLEEGAAKRLGELIGLELEHLAQLGEQLRLTGAGGKALIHGAAHTARVSCLMVLTLTSSPPSSAACGGRGRSTRCGGTLCAPGRRRRGPWEGWAEAARGLETHVKRCTSQNRLGARRTGSASGSVLEGSSRGLVPPFGACCSCSC